MTHPSDSIALTEYSLPELRYSQIFLERGYTYNYKAKWVSHKPTYEKAQKKLKHTPLVVSQNTDGEAILYEIDADHIALLDLSPKMVTVEIASRTNTSTENHIKQLKKLFPETPESPDKIKIKFWYNTSHGPRNVTRQIVVPEWKAISKNYEKGTLENLNWLMTDFTPSTGGQLIIFHGQPGTGKSYSLRALLNSWRSWASADYILDPENLFGGSSGYMADLVLRGSTDEYEYDPETDEAVPADQDKWKVLILEDSGELLSSDAKSRTGQGLSRLLNLVDGLIGQGLRVLVLITTNEELEKLHPAVSREGRCAAAIRFRSFDRVAALEWLLSTTDNVGIQLPNANQFYTLSDLYAHIRGGHKDDRVFDVVKQSIGFSIK